MIISLTGVALRPLTIWYLRLVLDWSSMIVRLGEEYCGAGRLYENSSRIEYGQRIGLVE